MKLNLISLLGRLGAMLLLLMISTYAHAEDRKEPSLAAAVEWLEDIGGCKLTGYSVGEEIEYCPEVTFHVEVCVARESLALDGIMGGQYPGGYGPDFIDAMIKGTIQPMEDDGHIDFLFAHVNPKFFESDPGSYLIGVGKVGPPARFAMFANLSVTGEHTAEVTVPVSGAEGGCVVFVAPKKFFLAPGKEDEHAPFVCISSPDINFKALPRLTDGPYQGQENVLCTLPADGSPKGRNTRIAEYVREGLPASLFPLIEEAR